MADNCPKTFTQQQHERYVRRVYQRQKVSRKAQRRVYTLRQCQRSQRARRNARALTRRLRARYKLRKLTPYNCGPHGYFAIPCPVIQCESKFSWTARNPSGAWGAYQLLGWLPYGSSRTAQHRMAAKLWAGGSGAGHWVCKA